MRKRQRIISLPQRQDRQSVERVRLRGAVADDARQPQAFVQMEPSLRDSPKARHDAPVLMSELASARRSPSSRAMRNCCRFSSSGTMRSSRPGDETQEVEKMCLNFAVPLCSRRDQTLERQCFARGGVAEHGQRNRQAMLRAQPEHRVPGALGQRHRLPGGALHRAVVGGAQRDVAAPPSDLAAPSDSSSSASASCCSASMSACCSARLPRRSSMRSRTSSSRQRRRSFSSVSRRILADQRECRLPHTRAPPRARARPPRVLGGAGVVLAGRVVVAGLLEVLGRRAQEVVGARAGEARQPCRHLGVALAPQSLEHGVVGDLVQDLMLEGVFAHAVEAGLRGAESPARARSRRAGAAVRCASMAASAWSQNTKPITDACCRASFSAGFRLSSRACSTPVSVCGTWVATQLAGDERPALAAGLDRALVDEHLDQLFHVERVALGAAADQLAQRRRNCRRAS